MFLTKQQVEKLLECPLTEDGEQQGWEVQPSADDEDRMEIRFNIWGPLSDHYERYVTVNGDVERWDVNENKFLPATFESLIDTYPRRNRNGERIQKEFKY